MTELEYETYKNSSLEDLLKILQPYEIIEFIAYGFGEDTSELDMDAMKKKLKYKD